MNQEIEKQIDQLCGSAIEFRRSIDQVIFSRLKELFAQKGKQISRDSKLTDLLGKHFTPHDWHELADIGLAIPDLKRHKAFNYLVGVYILSTIVTWIIIFFSNLEMISIVWNLPLGAIAGIMLTLTLTPILAFAMIFKKRLLPARSIDELIDAIIAENWANLLAEEKKLFREIIREELTGRPEARI